jgi:hypothetical protein
MKHIKYLFFLTSAVIFILACGARGLFELPADAQNKPLTIVPDLTPISTPMPTSILTPTFLFSTPQDLPFPAWIADFSDPILVALNDRQPDFQDDFATPNRGWFYFIPGSKKGPFYAPIQDEALLIKLSAEDQNRDSWVYSPFLTRRDFVLSFDFQFEETQPGDMVRFQFKQTAEQSVAFDLFKNQTWRLHWGDQNDWQFTTGTYDYYPPERITILVIMHGNECAVYLNDAPLTYVSNCRTGSNFHPTPLAVSFHMLAEPGHIAATTIDNVKLWDLDNISDLP